MMPLQSKTRMIIFLGLSLAIALILSYIESILPLAVGIPGVKLGLANLAVLLLLYLNGWKGALLVNVTRVFLSGFLFGNFAAIMYSLAGALLSFAAMAFLKKFNFRLATVSIGGGVTHNLGQLIVAAFVLESGNVVYYLPWLIMAGIVTGAVIGIAANSVLFYLKREQA